MSVCVVGKQQLCQTNKEREGEKESVPRRRGGSCQNKLIKSDSRRELNSST